MRIIQRFLILLAICVALGACFGALSEALCPGVSAARSALPEEHLGSQPLRGALSGAWSFLFPSLGAAWISAAAVTFFLSPQPSLPALIRRTALGLSGLLLVAGVATILAACLVSLGVLSAPPELLLEAPAARPALLVALLVFQISFLGGLALGSMVLALMLFIRHGPPSTAVLQEPVQSRQITSAPPRSPPNERCS